MQETILVRDVIRILEEWSPKHYAYDWDNVGLQVGSLNVQVNKVMLTLDVLENVVDEAIKKDVNLIIAHHPLLFREIKQINTDQSEGRILAKLLKHNITVYAAHTNLDAANGGVSDMLADRLEIMNRSVLIPSSTDKLIGIGRIGSLNKAITLKAFCENVKEKLAIQTLRVTGDLNKTIKKIAVLGGSGKDFIGVAKRMGADVYVTGDMTFHEAQDAMAMGLAVVDPGHHVEKVMIEDVKKYLEEQVEKKSINVSFLASESNTEPFKFL